MNSPAQNAVISENEANSKTKFTSNTFRPRATLLLDVQPEDELKRTGQKPADRQDQPQELLQQLLINTEASAQRTQSAKMKWQLATLALGMLLAAAGVAIGWMVVEMNADGSGRGRLETQNLSLKEQLDTANAQIAGLKAEMETLVGRNLELAGENAQFKSQIGPPVAAASTRLDSASSRGRTVAVKTGQQTSSQTVQKSAAEAAKTRVAAKLAVDSSRVEAIRKGMYSRGASRAELTAVLGEPDRVYKSRNYEQLVYFGRKPGRFWLIAGFLVQTSD